MGYSEAVDEQPTFENFELRFLPEWLKEPEPAPASGLPSEREESGEGGRPSAGAERRRDAARRPGRRDSEGLSPRGQGSDDNRDSRRARPRRDDRRDAPFRSAQANHPGRHGERRGRPNQPSPPPVNAVFAFKPEPQFAESVLPKLKHALVTFPLYKLAGMFLAAPERHRVVFKRKDPAGPGFLTTADGAFLVMDDTPSEQVAEIAFKALASRFYTREETTGPEIRGSFRSVAVCRLNGEIIGPSNHHSYLITLKRLYDERFSRRMSFERFKECITHVTDEETLNKWKEQARRKIIWRPVPPRPVEGGDPAPPAASPADVQSPASGSAGPSATASEESAESAPASGAPGAVAPQAAPPAETAEPQSGGENPEAQPEPEEPAGKTPADSQGPVFESEAAVRRDFAEKHLPGLLVRCDEIELSGAAARAAVHGPLLHALRRAFEAEVRFPESLGRALAEAAHAAGLVIFKLNRKIVCLSPVHPVPVDPDSPALAGGVAAILKAARANPGLRRADLAREILGAAEPPGEAADAAAREEFEKRRAAFLKDLRFAVSAGFLIEMNDTTLHLSSPPRPAAQAPSPAAKGPAPAPVTAADKPTEPAANPAELPEAKESAEPPEPAAPRETTAFAGPAEGSEPAEAKKPEAAAGAAKPEAPEDAAEAAEGKDANKPADSEKPGPMPASSGE